MLKSIIQRLNQPFPSNESVRGDIVAHFWVGVFIGSFLYLFKPFGLENEPRFHAWIAAGFGAVTFVFATIFDLASRVVLKSYIGLPSWTLWKWIIQCLVLIAWIAFGNILFLELLAPGRQMGLQQWLIMVPNTLLLGLFPIVFSGLLIQLRAERNFKTQALQIDGRTRQAQAMRAPVVRLEGVTSTNGGEAKLIELVADDLLMVEAMQNYMALYVRNADGGVVKHLLRSTLKELKHELDAQDISSLLQCHRSFIVNIDQVGEVSGNAQGLTLTLRDSELTVPVSRKYISEVRHLL